MIWLSICCAYERQRTCNTDLVALHLCLSSGYFSRERKKDDSEKKKKKKNLNFFIDRFEQERKTTKKLLSTVDKSTYPHGLLLRSQFASSSFPLSWVSQARMLLIDLTLHRFATAYQSEIAKQRCSLKLKRAVHNWGLIQRKRNKKKDQFTYRRLCPSR